jgi:hypothetical protein
MFEKCKKRYLLGCNCYENLFSEVIAPKQIADNKVGFTPQGDAFCIAKHTIFV